MTEKQLGAGGKAVRTRLQYHDTIADFCDTDLDPLPKQVQRRAQATDDVDRFARLPKDPMRRAQRKIFPHNLSEVAGCRKVMMQTTVGNQIGDAARALFVDDLADVDAGFANKVATQFEDHIRLPEPLPTFLNTRRKVVADRA